MEMIQVWKDTDGKDPCGKGTEGNGTDETERIGFNLMQVSEMRFDLMQVCTEWSSC